MLVGRGSDMDGHTGVLEPRSHMRNAPAWHVFVQVRGVLVGGGWGI